ncbi:MAG: translation elongation factor Ts [Saprospiraceae bacterium]
MKVSAKDIKKLRDQTGAGMMDCKKALQEAEGDFANAVQILRKKGQKIMGKRADRNATEGVVVAITNAEGNKGVVVNLSAETDFVSKNADFISLAKEIADIAIREFPATKDELNALSFNDKLTVGERTVGMAGVIGEKIEIKKYDRLEAAQVAAYIHMGYKVGVLLSIDKASEDLTAAGKNMAMQVAALSPIAVDKEDIPADAVEKERVLQLEMTRTAMPDKPEKMIQNIVNGKLNKLFFKEKTLMNQQYVKDSKSTVKEYLKSVDKEAKVLGFVRMDLA